MQRSFTKRVCVTAAVASTAALAVFPGPAAADDVTFPAGVACSFELRVHIVNSDHRVTRVFTDANGNTVRMLSAGRGSQLTFTNADTGRTLSLPANGAVARSVKTAGGLLTETDTGHNILILFPTDVPAGPSTTLYVGRIVFTVDAAGVFRLGPTSGRKTDICAALA